MLVRPPAAHSWWRKNTKLLASSTCWPSNCQEARVIGRYRFRPSSFSPWLMPAIKQRWDSISQGGRWLTVSSPVTQQWISSGGGCGDIGRLSCVGFQTPRCMALCNPAPPHRSTHPIITYPSSRAPDVHPSHRLSRFHPEHIVPKLVPE